MIGDNNPIVLFAFIAVCLALIRGIAIEGARIKNITARLNAPDEACRDAGSMTLLLFIMALGACGLVWFVVQ